MADEVNSVAGWALVVAAERGRIRRELMAVQRDLYVVGAMLASSRGPGGVALAEDRIDGMEATIDNICTTLPEQTCLIVPGGCELAARLHVLRTVVRRAERGVVAAHTVCQIECQPERIMRYFNRLSDLVFVLARLANKQAGIEDTPLDFS